MRISRQEIPGQQVCPVGRKHEAGEDDHVVRAHQADQRLKWYGRETVDHGQGVESEVDAQGIEQITADKGVGMEINDRVPDPPQVPHQRGVVAPVAGDLGGETENQGVGQKDCQKQIRPQSDCMLSPGDSLEQDPTLLVSARGKGRCRWARRSWWWNPTWAPPRRS